MREALGGILLFALGSQACALPRERTEVLGAEQGSAGRAVQDDAGVQPKAASADVPAASAPPAASVATGQAGSRAVVDAGSPPSAAGDMDAASPDECGDAFFACLAVDPFGFERCARTLCKALLPAPAPMIDAGTDKILSCSMNYADCLTRDPQGTQRCMAEYEMCSK